MDFTLGHLEFKKFRKRAEEIFFCVLSARPLQGLRSKRAIVREGPGLLDGRS